MKKVSLSLLIVSSALIVKSQLNTPISNIINQYTPVLGFDTKCKNMLTVGDATNFKAGDTVLIIQMKGAVIDSSNTAAFGTITDYKNAGNYEFNYIKSKAGNNIELLNTVTRTYDIADGKVQLIRVPYYQNATITSTLTCQAWNGSTGGVLVLNVQDSIVLNADIDVTGRGFRGGNDPFTNPIPLYCYEDQYYYPPNPDLASEKGEGIAVISTAKSFGKGALANGGGGGNSHNSGGGGGGNIGSGGLGGYQYEFTPCDAIVPFDNRGISGKSLNYSNATVKIFLGGGGGAGQSNNPEAFHADGGNGSGIIIILGDKLKTNGKKIITNGNAGAICGQTTSGCHEGMGGGGAAGTVLLKINNYLDNTIIEANGGKGADMTAAGFHKVAPGGGGSGGVVWLANTTLPTAITISNAGGLNGVCTAYSNDPWGATTGQSGATLFNLQMPIDNIAFKPNIDSVRIKDSSTACQTFDFKGLGYVNTNPILTWSWSFGDGGTAGTQNASHTFATAGIYNIKLVVTDNNGCKDSIQRSISSTVLNIDAGPDLTVCNNKPFNLNVTAPAASTFAWTPKIYLNDSTLQSPTANISTSTKFYITVKNGISCIGVDSVMAIVHSAAQFSISPPKSICNNTQTQLSATGGDIYLWSPANLVNNAAIANPITNITNTQLFSVKIKQSTCNDSATLSTLITVLTPPLTNVSKSNDIDCSTAFSQLSVTSTGLQYLWSPAGDLNNATIPNPIARPKLTTTYYVTITDLNGCTEKDSVTVYVTNNNKSGYSLPNAFTPNGDGVNDCFGIKYWGIIDELEFFIYNRYGEKVFHTTDPSKCWDGKYKTDKPEPGNYVYYIKAKTACGTVEKKGNVLLIR